MSYLDKIDRCNTGSHENYLAFVVDGHHVGWVKKAYIELLKPWFSGAKQQGGACVLHSEKGDNSSRTRLFAEIVTVLAEASTIRQPTGEMYPVSVRNREDVLALVDRVAASFFGIRCYGQHLNGYTREAGEIKMWVGRRAQDRAIQPGKLDQLVAGGLPHGISPPDNLLKECYEEAGIASDLAQKARPVGSVSYFAESEIGLKPDTLYVYDLELPQGFQPVCTDGEVEAFYLMPINEVAERVRRSDEFKHNCNLVVIDFLLRHGLITDSDPAYTEIAAGVHLALPALTV